MAGTHAPITPTTTTDTNAHTTVIGVNRISKASVVNVVAPNMSLVFPTNWSHAIQAKHPTAPPNSDRQTDSRTNPERTCLLEKPIVRSMAISRVRPATIENMVLAMENTAARHITTTSTFVMSRYVLMLEDCD